jgi:hypothetical protein
MKKYLLASSLLLSLSSFAQNCNIGNENSAGFTNSGDPIYRDYLLGVKFTLSQPGILNAVDLLGRNTGAQVQLAVYADNGGVPGNLVAATSIGTVGSGIISLPVAPQQLAAGDYWIMGVYSADGGHTYSTALANNPVYYTSLPFGNSIPSNASGFTSYAGTDFTYYMEISCGILGETELVGSGTMELFPNPASDRVLLCTGKRTNASSYVISDLTGMTVLSGALAPGLNTIDIHALATGIYFVRTNEGSVFRLIRSN